MLPVEKFNRYVVFAAIFGDDPLGTKIPSLGFTENTGSKFKSIPHSQSSIEYEYVLNI
jgi:hypothetical protein